jgi:hypothetical protein
MASSSLLRLIFHLAFALAALATAVKKTQTEIETTSTGFVNNVQHNNNNNNNEVVVRRNKKKARTSIFAGLLRTDRYSAPLRNLDCSSRHGGHDIDAASIGTSLVECKKMCIADDACTCISSEDKIGRCSKQRHCYAESCLSSSLIDTYLLHTTLKTQPSAYSKTENTTWPQFSFERSGGRQCTEVDGTTNLTADVEDDLSVTQCLNKCVATAGCKCVMYERYYQQVCFLKDNCPLPTFCGRSDKYDMYVHYDVANTNL